jgi:hypothetical protein
MEKSMRNILKRGVTAALVALLTLFPLAGLAPQGASAQGVNLQGIQVVPFNYVPVSNIVTAVDTEAALYIKYYGPGGASTTTVAVEADGNLTFVVNGAAYTGFECPVSGALGGVIDVSDSACNTAGEVVDIINSTATTFSTGYFRAVIAAGARADDINASWLADAADTEVTTPTGERVLWDSSDLDDSQVGLWNESLGIRNWISGTRVPSNAFADRDSVLLYAHENLTNAGTITNIEIHCTVENYKDGGTGSETDSIIYLEAAGATTATGLVNEFTNAGGLVCRGGKLWMRVLASGADTSAQTLFVTGYHRTKN